MWTKNRLLSVSVVAIEKIQLFGMAAPTFPRLAFIDLPRTNHHAEAEDPLLERGRDRRRRQASNETLSLICYKRAGLRNRSICTLF